MGSVFVVTPDIVPVDGGPATGAGLRALGLGEGLRSAGHDVLYVMPREHAGRFGRGSPGVLFYDPRNADDVFADHDPDVALFQHWPVVGLVSDEHRARIAIDFHGPLLLETVFRASTEIAPMASNKLRALARADYFTCASERQLYYFYSWLLLAGFDLREPPIDVIPFSMPPALPERSPGPWPPVFVFGGVFLPWQNPQHGLEALVSVLEERGRGVLRLFGGRHPWMTMGNEPDLERLQERLERSERVQLAGLVSRDRLIDEYTSATVAWDVMPPNAERRLAFTSRTVEYMWCGLPVVYNDYAELSEYIAAYDAGWLVDPDDAGAMRAVAEEVLSDEQRVREKAENARRLVRERLNWERTIDPLSSFCRLPRRAPRLTVGPLAERVAPPPPVRTGADDVFIPADVAVALERVRRALPKPVRTVLKRTLAARRPRRRAP